VKHRIPARAEETFRRIVFDFHRNFYFIPFMTDATILTWKALDPAVQAKALRYEELLHHWNRKINLISRKPGTFDFRVEFLDSLYPVQSGILPAGEDVADIGSGGGFPVIPLAIAGSGRNRFYAVESMLKKAVFLREAVRSLGLDNLEIINTRVTDKLPAAVQHVTLKKSIAPSGEIFYNLLNNNGLTSILYYAGSATDKLVYLKGLSVDIREYAVNSPDRKRYLLQIRQPGTTA
jgi:16S rRNA (guanine(527)-N(7))-methyltransferase RsmG